MHDFAYLAQRRSQEFSCEPNFGGGAPLAAVNHYFSSSTENISIPVCLWTPGKQTHDCFEQRYSSACDREEQTNKKNNIQ